MHLLGLLNLPVLSPAVWSQAATGPVVMALFFLLVLRRQSRWWWLAVALVAGFYGAFDLNTAFLNRLPSLTAGDDPASPREAWLSALVDAAIPEEVAKGAMLLLVLAVLRRAGCGHGALLGALVGIGFSFRENLAYCANVPELRLIAAVDHGVWGLIMGHALQIGWRPATSVTLDVPAPAAPTIPRTWTRWTGLMAARVLIGFGVPILLHTLTDAAFFLMEFYDPALPTVPTDEESIPDPLALASMGMGVLTLIVQTVWAVIVIRSEKTWHGLTAAR